MGNSQNSVNFQDHETKEELKQFLDRMKKDNEELKTQAQETGKALDSYRFQFDESVDATVLNFFRIQQACAAPDIVMWMSKRTRDECLKAKVDFYQSFNAVCRTYVQSTSAEPEKARLEARINVVDQLLKVNQKFA